MLKYGTIAIIGCILLVLLNGSVPVSCKTREERPNADRDPCPHVNFNGTTIILYEFGEKHWCCPCNRGEYVSDHCRKGRYKTTNCTVCPFDPEDPSNQFYFPYGPHNFTKCVKAIEKCKKGEKRIPGNRFENAKCEPLPVPSTPVTDSPTTVVTSIPPPVRTNTAAPSGGNIPDWVIIIIVVLAVLAAALAICCYRKCIQGNRRIQKDSNDVELDDLAADSSDEERSLLSGHDSGSSRADSFSSLDANGDAQVDEEVDGTLGSNTANDGGNEDTVSNDRRASTTSSQSTTSSIEGQQQEAGDAVPSNHVLYVDVPEQESESQPPLPGANGGAHGEQAGGTLDSNTANDGGNDDTASNDRQANTTPAQSTTGSGGGQQQEVGDAVPPNHVPYIDVPEHESESQPPLPGANGGAHGEQAGGTLDSNTANDGGNDDTASNHRQANTTPSQSTTGSGGRQQQDVGDAVPPNPVPYIDVPEQESESQPPLPGANGGAHGEQAGGNLDSNTANDGRNDDTGSNDRRASTTSSQSTTSSIEGQQQEAGDDVSPNPVSDVNVSVDENVPLLPHPSSSPEETNSRNIANDDGKEDTASNLRQANTTPSQSTAGSRGRLQKEAGDAGPSYHVQCMDGFEDENDPPPSPEATKSRNVESAPSTSAARGTKYTGANLSEAATTSRCKLSYNDLMAKIEEKFADGEDNVFMDGDDMSKILRHFKKATVVHDYGPNSRCFARKYYISEGFRQLMKLGEKEFNPQILLKLLRKYNLNSLADHFLKPICEENGYDLEEESPVPAKAGSLGEPRVSSANSLEDESHRPRANGMEAESHGPRASGLEAESHGPRASGLEAESHGPRASGLEAESHGPQASGLEADSLVSRENGCGLDEMSFIKDEPKS